MLASFETKVIGLLETSLKKCHDRIQLLVRLVSLNPTDAIGSDFDAQDKV